LAEAAGLYYETHGNPDDPPLILSSGLGGSASYWAPNIPALATRFHVIAYDHRGTGRSDRALPDVLTLAGIGADILKLMDALYIADATVCGHAIGAMAAFEAAKSAPDRVARIVAINAWAHLDPQTARCFDVRLTLLRAAGPEAYLHAQPLFLFPGGWLSENDAEVRAQAAHHLAHWPGNATMEKRIDAARTFDCREWIGEVKVPVLLVSAADDLLVPWICAGDLAERLPHADQRSFSWGAHAFNVTAADEFNREVGNWLANGALPVWN
jgi:aminoacrylate hydrolase